MVNFVFASGACISYSERAGPQRPREGSFSLSQRLSPLRMMWARLGQLTNDRGQDASPKWPICPYSLECVEGVFSEVRAPV
jgi:hypothetical protein